MVFAQLCSWKVRLAETGRVPFFSFIIMVSLGGEAES